MVVITTIIFLLLFFGTWGFFKYLDRQATSQLESIDSSEPETGQASGISQTIKEINPLLTLEGSLEDQIGNWSGILSSIETLKPDGVTITNLENNKDNQSITLIGAAQSREALASFRDILSGQDFAESVQMPTSNFAENQNINFTIVLILRQT